MTKVIKMSNRLEKSAKSALPSVFFCSRLFLLMFGLVVFYFLGLGLVTGPWEGDSLAYHLPLAERLLSGQWGGYDNLLFYYPATVHLWLAAFKLFHWPLQWFNVVGLLLFASGSYYLGRRLELTKDWAVVLAVTLSLLTPLARLITTQTVDIYVATFYVTLLAWLIKPQPKWSYFAGLGLIGALLAGSKYTGPALLLWLGGVFFLPVWRVATKTRLLTAFLLVLGLGGFWYCRNWLLMGDPMYPAHHPDFAWVKWHTWQTIVQAPGGWWYFLESLLSEYLFWPGLAIGLGYLAIKKQLTALEFKLTLLGWGNLVIHLLTPASIHNVLSDLRYTVPTFICFLAVAFLVAQRKNWQLPLIATSLLSVLASWSLIIPHRPKMYLLYAVTVGGGWLVWRWLKKSWLKKRRLFSLWFLRLGR